MHILTENINILACYSAGIRKFTYLYRRININERRDAKAQSSFGSVPFAFS